VILCPDKDIADPLYAAYCDHNSPEGRSSWGPVLILLAAVNDITAAGYESVKGHASADMMTGENSFKLDPAGPHEYVKKTKADAWYTDRLIEALGYSS
jgi:hypothetical protein